MSIPDWLLNEHLLKSGFLIFAVWLAYFNAIKGQWLIDDMEGCAGYDGKPQWRLDPKDKNYSPFAFATLTRWLRYHFGKSPNPNKNWKKDKQSPFIPNPIGHHRLNLYFASAVLVLLYTFLSQIIDPNLAWMACLLFAVHPMGGQTIAWISGIGYVLSLFFALLAGNLALFTQPWLVTLPGMAASVLIVAVFQYLSIQAQFATVGMAAIYAYLGLWPHAIVTLIMAVTVCRPVLQDAVQLRVKTFRDQQMGDSTYPFQWRKIAVVLKSIYYYTKLAIFPKRLGLYHTFGYHYERPYIEAEDKYMYLGLTTLLAWGTAAFFGPPVVQLSVLWFFAFIVLFLNWITIHQFVSERYNWVPSVGVCMIVAWICQTYNLHWLYWSIFGILIMRTWVYIPTFHSEIQFYQENVANFPNSEVAVGNLGVAYMRAGLRSAAYDMWAVGTRINPEYDVNWYNIYSILKGTGQFDLALQNIQKALSCRTCHFPKDWIREEYDLRMEIERVKRPPVGYTRPYLVGIRT